MESPPRYRQTPLARYPGRGKLHFRQTLGDQRSERVLLKAMGEESPSAVADIVYSSVFSTASWAPMNPMRLWVPSQKGLVTEPPQRQSEIHVFPSGLTFLLPSGMEMGFHLLRRAGYSEEFCGEPHRRHHAEARRLRRRRRDFCRDKN